MDKSFDLFFLFLFVKTLADNLYDVRGLYRKNLLHYLWQRMTSCDYASGARTMTSDAVNSRGIDMFHIENLDDEFDFSLDVIGVFIMNCCHIANRRKTFIKLVMDIYFAKERVRDIKWE